MIAELHPWITWYPLALYTSAQCGIPAALLLAIIAVESSGNPVAVSSAGAVGLMQIMPLEAGPAFADRPPSSDLMDPATNLQYGCSILAGWFRYYARSGLDDEEAMHKAIAAYFAGPSGVDTNSLVAVYLERVLGVEELLRSKYKNFGRAPWARDD